MERTIDPLTTMDAKLWADEFMATKARLGDKEFDHAMMLAWFANAIMVGYDEGQRRKDADAQATIAALEQRVKELKQWVQDQSTANLETMRHMDEMQSRAMDAESQLAQRTAELARVRKKLVETKLYIQQERANRDSLVACVNRDVKTIKELRTLILALPKVEGEIAVKHTEVDLSGVWGITLNGYFTFQSALFDSKEEADAYAALLTHRQGMEGQS